MIELITMASALTIFVFGTAAVIQAYHHGNAMQRSTLPEIGKAAEKGKYNREKAAPGHLTSAPIGLTKKTAQPNTLQRYFSDISQYKLLTREEEISLATRLHRHGDKAAANRLIASNLRLVVKIALDSRRLPDYAAYSEGG